MFKILKMLFKQAVTKPIKIIKKPFEYFSNTIKSMKLSKKRLNPFKTVEKTVKKRRKFLRGIKKASRNTSHAQKIFDVMGKARLVEQLTETQAEILRGKSSADIDTPEFIRDINRTGDLLKIKTKSELDIIEESLNNALKDLGIDSDFGTDWSRASEGQIFEKAFEQSFDTFMDNWKNAFFAYDPEDLGMSEDERDEVWKEVTDTRTYEWFIQNKLSPQAKEDKMFKDSKPQVIKL